MLCYSSKLYNLQNNQTTTTATAEHKKRRKSEMTKQQTATTTTTAFETLLVNFCNEYRKDRNSATFTEVATDLATAVAFSVLRKCLDPQAKSGKTGNSGCNPQLDEVKRSIYRDTNTLKNINYSCEKAFTTVYNEDGDRQTKTLDSDYRYAYNKLIQQTLGDGLDLVNTAIVSLLDECTKVDTTTENFLETVYTVRKLKKKVWIKVEDSVNGWETVETSPIREVYKAVRREVANNRSLNIDPTNGYMYLEDLARDEESNEETTIYRRLNKFSDLAGNVTDFNGAVKFKTVDGASVADYDKMTEALELTARQTQVLQLRMSGYGCVAIGTYLGVKEESVRSVLQTIQKKAIEKLYLPSYLVEAMTTPTATKSKLTDEDKKAIRKMIEDGHTMKFVADSYNVSKMTISRIVNGRKDR